VLIVGFTWDLPFRAQPPHSSGRTATHLRRRGRSGQQRLSAAEERLALWAATLSTRTGWDEAGRLSAGGQWARSACHTCVTTRWPKIIIVASSTLPFRVTVTALICTPCKSWRASPAHTRASQQQIWQHCLQVHWDTLSTLLCLQERHTHANTNITHVSQLIST
jgi:hypothetical protein